MPGLLDVLHDGADHADLAVRDAIDIDFDRVLQKTIHQHRPIRTDLDRVLHVTREIFAVVDELHRAAAEHKRRTHQHRIANLLRDRNRFLGADRGAARRLAQSEFVEHRGE